MTGVEVLTSALRADLSDARPGFEEIGWFWFNRQTYEGHQNGGGLVIALKEAAGNDVRAYNDAYDLICRAVGAKEQPYEHMGHLMNAPLRSWASGRSIQDRLDGIVAAIKLAESEVRS